MIFLEEIIRDIEEKHEITVHGTVLPNFIINGVRFLDQKDIDISHLTPNLLYLTDYERYGFHPLNGLVLYVNCQGRISDNSALCIDEDLDVFTIYNLIESRFSIYSRVEIQIRHLFNTLHNGNGMENILQKAYMFLDNPIVICDSSFSVIGSYPRVNDERNLAFVNGRLAVKALSRDNMMKTKISQRIYHSVYPFVVNVEDFPYDWVFESIRIKRAVVGYICIRCINRPLNDYELDYIHALTRIISIEMQKDDTYNNPQGIKYDMFLKELFNKQYDRETALTHLELIGMKPLKFYYILSTAFTNQAYKLMNSSYYIQQISAIFKNSITGVFGNRYVTLVASEEFGPMSQNIRDRLFTFLQMNHMIAAISYTYSDLWNSAPYAEQSQALLNDMLNTYNEDPIGYYHEYYLKHMSQLIGDRDHLNSMIHPAILQILEYDEEHNTNYYETLSTFFENNRNAPATAKALFIHKSTLFYRFEKMKQLFAVDLENSYALFTYEFSVLLFKTLKNKPKQEYRYF